MPFWGVQVKPGSPFTLKFDAGVRRRLHISQATLAAGTSNKTSVVQCNVGNKSPVLLCALLPDKAEAFTLQASSLLCMIDSEGNARKVVGCSCVVVKVHSQGTISNFWLLSS